MRYIGHGEAHGFTVTLPPGVSIEDVQSGKVEVQLEIAGYCGCGGELIRRGPSEWRCDKNRWWHKIMGIYHAHIIAQQGYFQQCLGPETRVKR